MPKSRWLLVPLLFLWTSCMTPKDVAGLFLLIGHGETDVQISDLPDGEHTIRYWKSHPNKLWRGKKWGRGMVKGGKREGPWTLYYPNGYPKMKTTYERGVMNGMTSYYFSRGWLKRRGMMREGARVGEWESWDWGEASDAR